MFDQPLLLGLVLFAAAAAILGMMSFTSTFGTAVLRRLPFVPVPPPPYYFLRWLTNEQLEKLRQDGVDYAPHAVRGENGIRLAGKDGKLLLESLNARLIGTFATGQSGTEELVVSFKGAPDAELDNLKIVLDGRLVHNRLLFWRNIIGRRRLQAILRDTFVPVVRKNIIVHLQNGRTKQVTDDGNFHICVWSSPAGSWRQKPPERLFGVPVLYRNQSFGLSGQGIPIFEAASDWPVAELFGNHCLFIHFNAVNTAADSEVALLARIMEAVREEMHVEKFLDEIVRTLPADGMPIGAANAGRWSVYDDGFSGRRRDVVKKLLTEILVPAVRQDIYVKQCGGANQPPLEDGMFHVFFQSSPLGSAQLTTPERIWGYRLLKAESAFQPSGRGRLLVADNGFAIGELVGGNLYLHADLLHHGDSKAAALLARVLVEARAELVARNRPSTATLGEAKDSLAAQVLRQLAAVKAEANAAAAAREAGQNLSAQLRATQKAERDCFRLEATPGEAIGQEFDELLKIRKVREVTVSDTALIVKTDVLYCVDPRDGVRHEIGAFQITIPTSKGNPHWKNLTRTAPGPEGKRMNAPHVNSEGNACLGNTKDLFPDLTARREFATAVELAIAFIESVNTSDAWGKYIVNWPVAHG